MPDPNQQLVDAFANQGEYLPKGKGNYAYQGVDKWQSGTLNEGTRIAQIEWRDPNLPEAAKPYSQYFTTVDEVENLIGPDGKVDVGALSERLQVQAHDGQYNAYVSIYEVTEDMPVAKAKVTDNPVFGRGGADQFFAPEEVKSGVYLEKVEQIDTINRTPRLPVYRDLENATNGLQRNTIIKNYNDAYMEALELTRNSKAIEVADAMQERQDFSNTAREINDNPELVKSVKLPDANATTLDLDSKTLSKVEAIRDQNLGRTPDNIRTNDIDNTPDRAPDADPDAPKLSALKQGLGDAAEMLGKAGRGMSKALPLVGAVGAASLADTKQAEAAELFEQGVLSADALKDYNGISNQTVVQGGVDPSGFGGEILIQKQYEKWAETHKTPDEIKEQLDPELILPAAIENSKAIAAKMETEINQDVSSITRGLENDAGVSRPEDDIPELQDAPKPSFMNRLGLPKMNGWREGALDTDAYTPPFTPGIVPTGYTQMAENAALPSRVPLIDAVKMLSEDAKTLNSQANLSEFGTTVRTAVNNPDAAQMFRNLDTARVEDIPAKVEPNMQADIRASKLLTGGAEASREAGIPLPGEQRMLAAQNENQNTVETDNDNSFGLA